MPRCARSWTPPRARGPAPRLERRTTLDRSLIDAALLTPHGFCLAWDPWLLRLHVASDAAIAASYYSIPLALAVIVVKRKDLAFSWAFMLSGAFILACGTTHVFDIWTLWNADYEAQGVVKAVTAVISMFTAIVLWPLIPRALQLPSRDAMQAEIDQKEAALDALKRETEDRQRTQDMLRQSQKMEAIGQLTGGVAHDFNNLLMVIQANLEVLRERAAAEAGLDKYVARALGSVGRANMLTGQLLSFARRQPLRPVSFDLNGRIRNLSELLPTTLGGSVRLELRLASDLWAAEADPNQLENALLNLAINARDAMPNGGVLSIRTRNVILDAAALGGDAEAEPGDYVALTVADDGAGRPSSRSSPPRRSAAAAGWA
jgi:signal transduction histidine kinase